jgi:diaminopropionate ammonia-lyase
MYNFLQYNINPHKESISDFAHHFNYKTMQKVFAFHKSIPAYAPSPLYFYTSLAKKIGVHEILIKDESKRFKQNAFKVLGSSYALAIILAKKYNINPTSFTYIQNLVKNQPALTFATATDGNHGKGLAWSAKIFHQKCMVYLPRGSSLHRLQAIQSLGAQAKITDFNYDDTVRYVAKLSDKFQYILLQDTVSNGYMKIPILIMQGYLTIIAEFIEQLKITDNNYPTHILLQAGVGSFAGAIVSIFKQILPDNVCYIIIEPTVANCHYLSSCSPDGAAVKVSGELNSIMTGLACGEVNPISWDVLKKSADCFISCDDEISRRGMRLMNQPLGNDTKIISGESGAVPLGVLYELCTNYSLKNLKQLLHIDSTSRIFMISTEGDTDPENYQKICKDQ